MMLLLHNHNREDINSKRGREDINSDINSDHNKEKTNNTEKTNNIIENDDVKSIDAFAAYTFLPKLNHGDHPTFLPDIEECEQWKKDLERYKKVITLLQVYIGSINGIVGINGLIISYDRVVCWQNLSILEQIASRVCNGIDNYEIFDAFNEHQIEKLYFSDETIITQINNKNLNNKNLKKKNLKRNCLDDMKTILEKIKSKILFYDCRSIELNTDLGKAQLIDDVKSCVVYKHKYIDNGPFTIGDFCELEKGLFFRADELSDVRLVWSFKIEIVDTSRGEDIIVSLLYTAQ